MQNAVDPDLTSDHEVVGGNVAPIDHSNLQFVEPALVIADLN